MYDTVRHLFFPFNITELNINQKNKKKTEGK